MGGAMIHCIIEKAREFQENIYFYFIDYAKVFDCGFQSVCPLMEKHKRLMEAS